MCKYMTEIPTPVCRLMGGKANKNRCDGCRWKKENEKHGRETKHKPLLVEDI